VILFFDYDGVLRSNAADLQHIRIVLSAPLGLRGRLNRAHDRLLECRPTLGYRRSRQIGGNGFFSTIKTIRILTAIRHKKLEKWNH
jgi:hypothetical protein